MPTAEIQTSLNGGELSPNLYARTDLTKFESGAALLRNFFVDFRGGVTNRPGTQFIAEVKQVAGAKRLLPFTVSTEAAYVLEFGALYIRVYLTGVLVDEVVTPYLSTDLALIKFTQSADVLTLVHPSYPPANLSRTSATVFNYAVITTGPIMQPPVIVTMVAPHSGPYNYGYLVTAVDIDGKEESLPSNPGVKHSEGQNETTNRVVGLSWTAPAQAVGAYNIYKWGPIDAVTLNPATVWGFIGTSQTTTFTDNNIAPDFSKQPPGWGDPFSGGQFQSIVVLAGGAGYDGVSGDWPTALPYVPLTITGDGTGAAGYAVIDHATTAIIGVFLTNPGKNYTHATVTAIGQGGTGATFTFTFSDIDPVFPGCTAYVQQRRAFAGSNVKPETLVLSQTGLYNNFNTTPISLSTDAIVASIAGEQVNTIKSMVPVSYGLLLFTTSEVVLMNGGTPYASIEPSTISFQSQSAVGANDLIPLRVNTDIVYRQNKGNRVRNLSYAWQKQAYQGSDISALAAHLFDGFSITEWCWAEEPFKIVWAVRDDGRMLSLTYVPDQEVAAWCRHDTQGLFQSVCTVPEGDQNAVYVIVERYIPELNLDPTNPAGNWFQYIERFADRMGCCIFDSWFLDCALSLPKPTPGFDLFLSGTTGDVSLISTSLPLGPRTPDVTGIRNFNTAGFTIPSGRITTVDWTNGLLFVYSSSAGKLDIFNTTTFALTTATIVTSNPGNVLTCGEDHFLYGAFVATNQGTLTKMSPTTGALLASFGVAGPNFATDLTHWAFPQDMDTQVDSQGNHWMVSSAQQNHLTTNEVAIVNTDSMTWSGTNFHTDEPTRCIVAGPVEHVYLLSLEDADSIAGLNMGLYDVDLGPIFIMNKNALIAASVIPSWTHVSSIHGLVFDSTDGNVLAHVTASGLTAWASGGNFTLGQLVSDLSHDYESLSNGNTGHTPASSPAFWRALGPSGPAESRIVKFNAHTGAYMWSVVISTVPGVGRLNDSVIARGQYLFFDGNSGKMNVINTLTGTVALIPISGVTPDYQLTNDALGLFYCACTYADNPGVSPAPIGGAPTSWVEQWASFGPAPPAPSIGAFTTPGQVIQIGCGKIVLNTVTGTTQATGTVTDDLDDLLIPNDPDGTPIFVASGSWTLTTPISVLTGLHHLEGKEVWALADGIVYGPLVVVDGGVTIPTPSSNIVVGLLYSQQIQTLYLTMDDLQQGSIQGKRKLIPAVTLRVDCTKGLTIGQDFDNLTPVVDLNDVQGGGDLPARTLFLGDARTVIGASWDEKGEICIEQTLPLPATVLGIIVEVVPGDTGR